VESPEQRAFCNVCEDDSDDCVSDGARDDDDNDICLNGGLGYVLWTGDEMDDEMRRETGDVFVAVKKTCIWVERRCGWTQIRLTREGQ
jgi:hypothetical protein